MRHRAAVMLATTLSLAPEAAPAQSVREWRDTIGLTVNNLGLQNTLDVGWRWRWAESSAPLERDRSTAVGLSPVLAPSYLRLGLWAEVTPLAVVTLRAGIEPALYLDTFNALLGFDSYDDDFGSEALDARQDSREFGAGGRAFATPTLRARVGPAVAQASAEFERWWSSADSDFFYEPRRDTLLRAKGDWLLLATGSFGFRRETPDGHDLTAGVVYRSTYVFDAPANRIDRVGLAFSLGLGPRRFGLPNPILGGGVDYYLKDPTKKGELGAALGIAFRSSR